MWHYSAEKRKLHVHCSVLLGYITVLYFLNVIYGSVTSVHINGIAGYLQAHRTSADMSSSSVLALVTWQ